MQSEEEYLDELRASARTRAIWGSVFAVPGLLILSNYAYQNSRRR